MSYSRWGTSRWYTYWCAQNEEDENRDTALFQICGTLQLTSKQIRDDINECLENVRQRENHLCKMEHQVTDEEIEELKKYMRRFLKNVERSYPEG